MAPLYIECNDARTKGSVPPSRIKIHNRRIWKPMDNDEPILKGPRTYPGLRPHKTPAHCRVRTARHKIQMEIYSGRALRPHNRWERSITLLPGTLHAHRRTHNSDAHPYINFPSKAWNYIGIHHSPPPGVSCLIRCQIMRIISIISYRIRKRILTWVIQTYQVQRSRTYHAGWPSSVQVVIIISQS